MKKIIDNNNVLKYFHSKLWVLVSCNEIKHHLRLMSYFSKSFSIVREFSVSQDSNAECLHCKLLGTGGRRDRQEIIDDIIISAKVQVV